MISDVFGLLSSRLFQKDVYKSLYSRAAVDRYHNNLITSHSIHGNLLIAIQIFVNTVIILNKATEPPHLQEKIYPLLFSNI